MRRALALTALTAAVLGGTAAPALAGPPVPTIPDLSDCNEVQDFFGIDNVRDCEDPAAS